MMEIRMQLTPRMMRVEQRLIQRLQWTADACIGVSVESEADALERRRHLYALTEAEFAQILGIQLSQYNETIHGQRRLPVKSVVRAIAIGVLPEPLLFGRIKTERELRQEGLA